MKRELLLKRIFLLAALLGVCIIIFLLTHTHVETYQGYVEGENLYITSPYEGKLVSKCVSRGEHVKKGQLLFKIDPNPEELLISQLRSGVNEAKFSVLDLKKPRRPLEITAIEDQIKQIDASLDLADIRVKRFTELYAKQAVDLDHLDESKSAQQQLQASKAQMIANLELAKLGARIEQIKAQEAKLEQAKLALRIGKWKSQQKVLTAPADGVIFDTYFQEGEFVVAERPIGVLLPMENVRIEFFVPASKLPRLTLNQTVYFTCDGCQQTQEASINYISPEAEYIPPLVYTRENSDKIVFRVKAKIKNPQLFKPGQPVLITGFTDAK